MTQQVVLMDTVGMVVFSETKSVDNLHGLKRLLKS